MMLTLMLSARILLALAFVATGYWGYRKLDTQQFNGPLSRAIFGAVVGLWPLVGYTLFMATLPPSRPGFWYWWMAGLLVLGLPMLVWLAVCIGIRPRTPNGR